MGISKEQKNRDVRICECGCHQKFKPFPVYKKRTEGGGLRYPKYIRGHAPGPSKTHFGKLPAWNKGLKKGDHPSLEKMGFRKGHPPYYRAPRTKDFRIDPRNSRKYKTFCAKIYSRDEYTCQSCGDHNYKGRGGSIRLEVHHIVPLSLDPSRLYEETNVTTLCHPCHKKTDSYGGKMKRYKKKDLNLGGVPN